MRPIQTVPVQYDRYQLKGGLDLVTPTLGLGPGVARDALNFEVSVTGGYSRVAGYERYDGTPGPNTATYGVFSLPDISLVSVGQDLWTDAGARRGTIVAITGSNVIYANYPYPVFTTEQNVYAGTALNLVGTAGEPVAFAPTPLEIAQYQLLAADRRRTGALGAPAVSAVPGTGPVRGVATLNGVVYAWRDSTATGELAMWRADTTLGWQQVPLPLQYQLPFSVSSGTTPPAPGTVIALAGSPVTATVRAVAVRNQAAWGPGATGHLYITYPGATLPWANGSAITVAGLTIATATGPQTTLTWTGGGRVQTVRANLTGARGAVKLYGCDGVNPAWEFDGTSLVPIYTGMPTDAPTNVAVHRNHLFLSFGASLQHSAVGSPYVWTPVLGAGEIGVLEDVTALQPMPGTNDTAALAVFTRDNTLVLYGSSPNWNLVTFDRGTGAARYTVQTMVDAYMLDDRGVVSLSTSQNFGNFDSSTLTFPLRPWIQARRGRASASIVNREKSQYRVFYNDGSALYVTIVNGRLQGSMPVQFPAAVTCATEGDADIEDQSFVGAANGFVYKLETGPDFDGIAVEALLRLNFNAQGNARVLKRYRRASLEINGDGFAAFDFNYSLAYDSTEIDQAPALSYEAPFSVAQWDAAIWDSFVWDGRRLAPSEVLCDGTGENIAVVVRSVARVNQPFTINSITLHYSIRRGLR